MIFPQFPFVSSKSPLSSDDCHKTPFRSPTRNILDVRRVDFCYWSTLMAQALKHCAKQTKRLSDQKRHFCHGPHCQSYLIARLNDLLPL